MFHKFILCALIFSGSLALTGGEQGTDSAVPLGRLDVDALPAEWASRMQSLQVDKSLVVEFEEARHFAFRREPKQYRGVFRRSSSGSISLAYDEPELLVIHVSADSILARKGDSDRVHELSGSRAEEAGLGIFRSLLGFDLVELSEQYELFGGMDGEAWLLECRVKEDVTQAPKYSVVRLCGERGRLTKIELQEDPRRRVEIELGEPVYQEPFSSEVRERYFLEKP